MGYLLEIAAGSLESALVAQRGGADRVELCENLGEGGCTPSYGTVALARERLRIPLYVLIRPRGGDFVYSPAEWEVMARDVASCRQLGCDGVVLGALDAAGQVDVAGCAGLIAEAGTMGVTFHRAFDCVADPAVALEQIIGLGCERVLTSGAASAAPLGADAIARAVRQAGGRLSVMPGAGITADNVAELARQTGAREFHASARQRIAGVGRGLDGLETGYWCTEIGRVEGLRRALAG
ncbi:copper homeostasis protein CutC [Pseudoxanthomonas sp. JBR18]|uniref:copper homeostasis protein CutC n=1 Tax=Pseudoxanthomonas sp. JBR18 TaxID=2969308 RepID=UPI00230671AF|nr:copper homeostasis protein CutC [Pseudoxanthomonas sp. JBR18]WCE04190.1 copper homeostasis protein CutC [Pseudoxanthomonas sp. JBR18]